MTFFAHDAYWPSIAEDSEILRKRIAPELRVLILRRVLHAYLDLTSAA
jgi:hypothetical protein